MKQRRHDFIPLSLMSIIILCCWLPLLSLQVTSHCARQPTFPPHCSSTEESHSSVQSSTSTSVSTKKKELQNFFTYQGAVQLSHNFSLERQLLAKMKISAYSSNTGRVTKEHALFFPKLPLCSSLPSSLAPEIQVNIYTTELAVLLLRFWIHRIPKKVPICAQKFRTSTLCLITASRTPAQLQWSWTPHSNLISNLTG